MRLRQRVMQRRKVLDEGGEILPREAEDAGGRQGFDGRRATPIFDRANLAKVIAGPKLPDPLLLTVDVLEDLDFAGGDDVEAAAGVTLTDDRLAGAKPHWQHRVTAADRERREVVGQHGTPHPVEGQPEAATPGGHEGKKQPARNK